MKSYTDLEQSKKLAKILPIESADMFYRDNGIDVKLIWEHNTHKVKYPCWSLAALLKAVDFSTINLHYDNARTDWVASATIYDSTKHCTKYESTRAFNLVDACYEMIIKLKEAGML